MLFGKSAGNDLKTSPARSPSAAASPLRGSSGRIDGTAVVNQGTIAADARGGGVGTLTISPTSFTNQGTLQATNAATLALSGLAPGVGTISVGVGSVSVKVTGGLIWVRRIP